MDSEYYFAGGLRLAQGHSFSEMLVWNYLGVRPNDLAQLPQPSHGYWMPLTSMLAALGMWLTGSQQFWAGRLGFLGLAALLPVFTAALSFSFTRQRGQAWLAGLLAVFSAFYFPYTATTDAFGPYMLFGVLFWLLLRWDPSGNGWRQLLFPLGLGALAGGMHLSRADGLLWLSVAGLAAVWHGSPDKSRTESIRTDWPNRAVQAALCGLGYLLIMGPWLLRNQNVFGTLLSPGGSQALWMTDYNELFIYPASLLTLQRWWASGLGAILRDRAWAFGLNLQTAIAVQGEVFLLPLILAGLWKLRRETSVRWGVFAWLLTFGVMTLVFPYAGARGGFFHSGAAFQPLFWAVAPIGLEAFLAWGGRVRRWNLAQARRVFQTALVLLAVLLSGFVFYNRVIGEDFSQPGWNRGEQKYMRLEQELAALGAQPGDVVMVNNPPGYFLASQRPAISIPYGGLSTLLSVAERYQAQYLLVELEQVQGVELFAAPGDQPGLHYLENLDGVRIYQFTGEVP